MLYSYLVVRNLWYGGATRLLLCRPDKSAWPSEVIDYVKFNALHQPTFNLIQQRERLYSIL